jgi:hypothetical protein
MEPWAWIVIIVVALVVLALAAWAAVRTWRTRELRERFGPEYERVVEEHESRSDAERELLERRRRREQLDIQALPPERRDAYRARWEEVQARFVDDPASALVAADELVTEVLRERGYPFEDFEQRVADLSVDHPELAARYREARATLGASLQGPADTDRAREAMVHYRSLFEELTAEAPELGREAR